MRIIGFSRLIMRCALRFTKGQSASITLTNFFLKNYLFSNFACFYDDHFGIDIKIFKYYNVLIFKYFG